MKDELEEFENRRDDWLAKERKYEETVSAWDFDEAKKIRKEHHDNCDAYDLKETHHQKHIAYNNTHRPGLVKNHSATNDYVVVNGKRVVTMILAITCIVFMLAIMGMLYDYSLIDVDTMLGIDVTFISIVVAVVLSGKEKRE